MNIKLHSLFLLDTLAMRADLILLASLAAANPPLTALHTTEPASTFIARHCSDIDYGGLRILAQLREKVSPRFALYRMDKNTLDTHAHWGQPLSSADERNLARLKRHPLLADVTPLVNHMLSRGIKLEQEAVALCPKAQEML